MKAGTRSGARRLPTLLIVLALIPALAACDLDTVLAVDDPFTVTPGTARDTANLETLYAGSRAWFALGYTGQQNREGGLVVMAGLMSDELYASDQFNTRRAVDRRSFNYENSNSASDAAFTDLQRARAEALNAADLYETSPRSGDDRHAELLSIAAYSVVLLAEHFCAGIPLSRITETGVDFGEPQSAPQLYNLAISYFDEALAMSSPGTTQHNLASVGKGRALVDLGLYDQAAAAVEQVPTGFVFDIEHAPGSFTTPNAIYNFNHEERRVSASLQEGTVNMGLPYGAVSEDDPRVDINLTPQQSNAGMGLPTFFQLKYTSQGAPVALATGIEARLIEAEAQLDGGASAAYLGTLNTLRDGDQNLAPLTDPGSAAGRVDQFFRERAYWLYLEGHRLSDLRRLIRQYGRDQSEVFPTGVTRYELEYGDDVSMPIPFEEINNPNYTTCSNRGA